MNISAGTVIIEDMLTYKRPGTGISPTRVQELIGKEAAVDILEDTILMDGMIE